MDGRRRPPSCGTSLHSDANIQGPTIVSDAEWPYCLVAYLIQELSLMVVKTLAQVDSKNDEKGCTSTSFQMKTLHMTCIPVIDHCCQVHAMCMSKMART